MCVWKFETIDFDFLVWTDRLRWTWIDWFVEAFDLMVKGLNAFILGWKFSLDIQL